MSTKQPQVRAGLPRGAFRHLLLNEGRLTLRNPRGLIVGFGLPLLLAVVFGTRPKFRVPMAALGGLTRFEEYVPILICFAVAAFGLFSLPSPLATYREHGILRRLSTTPVSPAWVLAAQILINLCLVAVSLALLVLLFTMVFGFQATTSAGAFLVTAFVSAAGLFAIGIFIAALAPSGVSAYLIGAFTFLVFMFFAGLWVPRASMSQTLVDVGNYTPLGASVQAFQSSLAGTFPPVWQLLVLAGYAVVFSALAVRFFRWQ